MSEWVPVVGYEELYEVNRIGQVRNKRGREIKQQTKNAKYSKYKRVSLQKDGKCKIVPVHRIVAMAFIPNPKGLPIVNHKDEDGTNNSVENLEWCNKRYNAIYGSSLGKIRNAAIERNKRKRKTVLQFDMNGNFLAWYPSASEAAKSINGAQSNISAACMGLLHSAYGYKWAYIGG